MSSVDGSGRDEAVSRAREEYIKRENELIKKHKKELRRIQEANMSQVDNLKRMQSDQIKNMRTKTQEAMTMRDHKHQKDMNQLRDMHHKQLQGIMKDNETRLRVLKESTNNEIHQANLGKEDRVKELNAKYNESVDRLKTNLDTQLNESRAEQAKSIEEMREKLNKKHREERIASRQYNDRQKAELQNKLRVTRNSSKERLRDKEIQHMNDKQRMSNNFMSAMQREREITRDNMALQREGFQDSLDKNRDSFRKQFEKDAQARTLGFQNLKRDVNGRINERVGRLEQENADLKHQNIRNEVKQKQKSERYVRKMQDAYQEKFEVLENMRKDAIQANNDQNHKNIKDIRKETSDLLQSNSRYYRGRMETENFKNREALRAQEQESAIRHQVQQQQTDERVLNVRAESDRNIERLRDNYTQNLEETRRSGEVEKRDLRLTLAKDKSESLQRMKEQFQKQEATHARKMNDIRNKYEKRITELQDGHTREKRIRDQREKTVLATVKRNHQNQLDTQKMQFTDKMNQTKATHKEEIVRVEKRHKAEMDSILRTIKQQNLEKA